MKTDIIALFECKVDENIHQTILQIITCDSNNKIYETRQIIKTKKDNKWNESKPLLRQWQTLAGATEDFNNIVKEYMDWKKRLNA